jgi:hypothetical protein
VIETLQPSPQTGEFLQIFNRLCVALRDPGDDSGVTQQIYFDALKDLPIPAIDMGAANLMRESGRRFFPTTAEWRSAAELAHDALLRKALTPGRSEPWKHDCAACEDTGWVQGLSCPESPCGREKAHQPHTYVRACPCRATNRTFQRHQKFGSGE